MSRRIRAAVLLAPVMALDLTMGAMTRLAAEEPRSIQDGVYSDAQAARGREAFVRTCAYCHGSDLRGGDDPPGPALGGPIFLAKWRRRTVADLFLTIGETMPRNRPGTLAPETAADIVAFVLKSGGLPAGGAELPPDAERLGRILMSAQSGGQR